MGMMTADPILSMATPGELIRAVADGTGLPETTVFVYDRAIAEAGMRSKAGRGGKAAKVTARDAAHLLTAILGSGQVKDSVQTVRRYGETRPQRRSSSKKLFAQMGLKELSALPADHTFIDGVEALIASAATGSLRAWLEAEAKAIPSRTRDVAPLIEIAALTPGTVGDIRIAGMSAGVTANVHYTIPSPWDASKRPPAKAIAAWEMRIKTHRLDTDLEQYRRISARTILRIAEALEPEETD
jgi:hypothetical protein